MLIFDDAINGATRRQSSLAGSSTHVIIHSLEHTNRDPVLNNDDFKPLHKVRNHISLKDKLDYHK